MRLIIGVFLCAVLLAQSSHWPEKGDTPDQVRGFLGQPDYVLGHMDRWYYYSKQDAAGQFVRGPIWVTFKRGTVSKVKYQRLSGNASSNAEAAGSAVGQIVSSLYLTHTCPQIRSKSLLFWTAADAQTWQACVTQGWFLGPLYIYTGAQPQ